MKYIPDAFNFEKIGSVAASIIAERTKANGSHGKALVSFTINLDLTNLYITKSSV